MTRAKPEYLEVEMNLAHPHHPARTVYALVSGVANALGLHNVVNRGDVKSLSPEAPVCELQQQIEWSNGNYEIILSGSSPVRPTDVSSKGWVGSPAEGYSSGRYCAIDQFSVHKEVLGLLKRTGHDLPSAMRRMQDGLYKVVKALGAVPTHDLTLVSQPEGKEGPARLVARLQSYHLSPTESDTWFYPDGRAVSVAVRVTF